MEPSELWRLGCICHGTTFDAFPNILRGSLKPGSMVEPEKLTRPGSGCQRSATGGAVGEGHQLARNVLMMSPYPFFDRERYVSGARKDSELYLFLHKSHVAKLI